MSKELKEPSTVEVETLKIKSYFCLLLPREDFLWRVARGWAKEIAFQSLTYRHFI